LNISDAVHAAAIDRCLKESDLNADISGLTVELLRMRVNATLPKIEPAQLPVKGEDPSAAFKGEREVWRGSEKVTSKVYEWDKLETGNVITGHALIEGTDTTYVVPRGWEFKLDAFRNGVLTRRA
jgi:N-methylhydantoinase A/oxoprolinase/acetone carboxylase beta subunit